MVVRTVSGLYFRRLSGETIVTVMVLATAVLYALCVWLMNRGTGLRE